MSVLDIVLIVVALVLLAMVLLGLRGARARQEAGDAKLLARLATANEALAQAHAGDRGWDKATMEAAARAAAGGDVETVQLVQVIDRPGTDRDEAVYSVVSGGRTEEIRLHRRGDAWHAGTGAPPEPS